MTVEQVADDGEKKLRAVLIIAEQYGHPAVTIPLYDGYVTLGRKADIVLEYEYISSLHAAIEICEHNYWLQDLNSTNGTYIGKDVQPQKAKRYYQIKDGDMFRLGRMEMQFKLVSASSSMEQALAEMESNSSNKNASKVSAGDDPLGDDEEFYSVQEQIPALANSNVLLVANSQQDDSKQYSNMVVSSEVKMEVARSQSSQVCSTESQPQNTPGDAQIDDLEEKIVPHLHLTQNPNFAMPATQDSLLEPMLDSDLKQEEDKKLLKAGNKQKKKKASVKGKDVTRKKSADAVKANTSKQKDVTHDDKVEEAKRDKPQKSTKSQRRATRKLSQPIAPQPQAASDVKYKISLTKIELSDKDKVALQSLGISIEQDLSLADYLVTNKIYRTPRFLCAISKGVQILSDKWLTDSVKDGELLNPVEYQLRDVQFEKDNDFVLQESIEKGLQCQSGFMNGYQFVLDVEDSAYSNCEEVILASGGEVLQVLPMPRRPNVLLITDSTQSQYVREARDAGWQDSIYSKELIIMSALKQTMDLENFQVDSSRRASSQKQTQRKRKKRKMS
ncbi:hypothetical protein MIR68_005734 [Amoeboaphelidium protococcarum]|nr:hypothetical protein MIR68_005734 [Amoeboaphelidium protococcarum]